MLAALLAGLYWFRLGLAGRTAGNEARWARKVFLASIAVVTVLSVAMSVDAYPRPVPLRLALLTQGVRS
jgi:protoheme IX farnesyltransferase